MKIGIQRDDPLSPFLFIILAEVLWQLISKAQLDRKWHGLKIARGVDPITHLQFVDDKFLMGEASIKEAHCIKKVVETYSNGSG